ncbi:unknown protein [Seminavis robusta]|uniref:Uncharacterized protein n=1 Tax=Seminavis robusta TaxID=568900 RepID=A0A9N8EZX2_9STRA|nr:unknown protein [Seminavis robusta]|eukprot:Sro2282_g321830.1 n/a (259) ;mRNA; r:3370-4146
MEKSKASTESTDDTLSRRRDPMFEAEKETVEPRKDKNGSGSSTDGSPRQDQLHDLDAEKGQKGVPDNNNKQSGTLISSVAASEGAMDSIVGSIEPLPTRLPRLPSEPGAYAERHERINTPRFGGNQLSEPPRLDVVDEANVSPAGTDVEKGLVEATPVDSPIMAAEPAEPVDHDRQQGNATQQGPNKWNMIGCISAAIITVLLLFVLIIFPAKNSSVETPTPSSNTTILDGEDDSVVTIVLPSGLQLNLPLELTNNTL